MADFECHVTLVPVDEPYWLEVVEHVAKTYRFKTSFIVGDPVLGKAKYFYCTGHDVTYDALMSRMNMLVKDLPTAPVRRKIEQVLFDERTPA